MLRPFFYVATVAALALVVITIAERAPSAPADAVGNAAQTFRKAGFPDVSELELHECAWNKPYVPQGEAPVAHSVFFVLDGGKKQVLGWNGLPFTAISIGGQATADKELGVILRAPANRLDQFPTNWPALSAQPLAVVMLELNGQSDAARKLLAKTGVRPTELTLRAGDLWLRSLRADGASAFCGSFGSFYPKIVAPTSDFARAKIRFQTIQGAARVLPPNPKGNSNYEAEATQTLADIARRETELPPPTEEVPRLIWDLQNVAARQMSIPGGIEWRTNPTIQKLIQLRDKAMPALLDCVQNDNRLTLSYSIGGSLESTAEIAPVSEAAQQAATAILGRNSYYSTLDYTHSTPKQRQENIAAQMRADWEKMRGLSSSDCLWVPFSDPHATAQRLLEVAGELTDRSIAGSPSLVAPMHGEGLRARKNPSVSDVFERQIVRLSDARNIGSANQLAEYYAHWDPTRAAPFLGGQLKRTMPFVKGDGYAIGYSWPHTQLDFLAARVRVPSEKAAALRDYGAFLHGRGFGTLRDESYEALARFPSDPSIKAAALELFGGHTTPFQSALMRRHDFPNSVQSLDTLHGPLMKLPVFKAAVLRELANRTPIGFLRYESPTMAAIDVTVWQAHGMTTPAKLHSGEKRPLRICDMVGYGLRGGETNAEMSLLNLAASGAERDARLKQVAASVRDGKTAFDAHPMMSVFR